MAHSLGRLGRLLLPAAVFAAVVPATALAGPVADPAHPELSPRLDKLDSPGLLKASPAEQAAAVVLPAKGAASLQHRGDAIVVEIRFRKGAAFARDALEAAGAHITDISEQYQTVSASVAPEDFKKVSDVPGVESVTEALAPMVGGPGAGDGPADGPIAGACPGGNATSEGDVKLNAAALRSALGVDGSGQKVGVISDSYDTRTTASTHAAQDVASGDLPGTTNPCGRNTPVDVLFDTRGPQGDEGRAMLQLVHDVAPGASLAFADSATTQTEFANRIRALKNAGATVISDDITFFAEPFFQKGPIDAAVDEVNAAGIPFFSDAANMNIRSGGNNIGSWEAPAYRPTTCPAGTPAGYDSCMDFDPGAGTDPTYGFTGSGRLSLQWAEPWNGVATDLDILLFNNAGTFLGNAQSSVAANVLTTQQPFETIVPAVSSNYQVVIGRFTGGGGGGTATPRTKMTFLLNGSGSAAPTEYTTSNGGDVVGPSIYGHNGSENGSSVAATDQASLTVPEDFSSRGPVTHYFGPVNGTTPASALASPQVLQKPDVTATDKTLTTFFGPGNRFGGTSAASPHAAAVAALMKSADPTLTPEQVRELQAQNATSMAPFGPLEVGAGLVNATAAAPRPRVQVNAAALTNSNSPVVTFSANRPTSFACSIDGAAASACTSPLGLSGLGDGSHTVSVTATDALAHTGTQQASFTVDTTPPSVAITSGPSGPTRDTQARFGFAAEPGASVVCHYDGAPEGPCSGPDNNQSAGALPDGAHTFEVVAVDAAGNRSTAGRAFSVDTASPGVTISSGPNGATKDNRPTFRFASPDAGASLTCSVDGAAAAPCSGSFRPATSLNDGAHTFQVVAADAAGNTSPAQQAFSVDTKKPTAKVKKGPKKRTPSHKATFTLSSNESGATFKCKLDKGKTKACKSKASFKVKKGKHTVTITATDAAGNASKAVKFKWTVTR